jgi:hypothetical protein
MAIAMAMAIHRNAVPPESRIPDRPRQIAPGDFATSTACKACHPREYATWFGSYHRTMTQVATPETALAPFDGVVPAVHGRPMQLSTHGSELWADFDDPDSNVDPGRRARITRRVVMITGSHNQQIYWYATGRNRMLGQLPGAYLLADRKWIPRRAAVLHPPSDPPFSETGHWNSTCIACHATDGRPRFDKPFGSAPLETEIADTEVTEFGIACRPATGRAARTRAPITIRCGATGCISPAPAIRRPGSRRASRRSSRRRSAASATASGSSTTRPASATPTSTACRSAPATI